MKRIVEQMDIGRGASKTQVAVVKYAGTSTLSFNLRTHSNKADLLTAIDGLQQTNDLVLVSESNLVGGINTMRSNVFGSNGNRDNNPDVAIIFNSGKFYNPSLW